jgi:hypothetical protein
LGCSHLFYRTPDDIEQWQPTDPPVLTLAEKARGYQERLEERHQMPDGLIRYKRMLEEPSTDGHGNLADGSFFLGIYLASQSLRWAATGDPAAWEQVKLSLRAMRLYAEVSGEPGLLARYFSPVRADDPRWLPSSTHPEYFWRSDVSKDQYAGFVHGLGVTFALIPDAEIRAEVAALAGPIADHLIENDLRIIDWDGERTTYGDLNARIFGFPVGVNASIALAIATTAAAASGEPRHADFRARLVSEGYPRVARSAHWAGPGSTKRVNYQMAYLALYPLLLLERDEKVRSQLRDAEERLWRRVRGEHNAFFAFVHAVAAEATAASGAVSADSAREIGRASLRDFPDRKIAWPVDLTRPGFDFPRALFSRPGRVHSRRPVPLHLRKRSSSMWGSDPYRLVGRLGSRGDLEFAGIDYLVAYWIGRYHRIVGADE